MIKEKSDSEVIRVGLFYILIHFRGWGLLKGRELIQVAEYIIFSILKFSLCCKLYYCMINFMKNFNSLIMKTSLFSRLC